MSRSVFRNPAGGTATVNSFEISMSKCKGVWDMDCSVDLHRLAVIAEMRAAGYFIFEPPLGGLPHFIFLIEVGLPSSIYEYRFLRVCWFANDLPEHLHSAIALHLRQVDWDEHALVTASGIVD